MVRGIGNIIGLILLLPVLCFGQIEIIGTDGNPYQVWIGDSLDAEHQFNDLHKAIQHSVNRGAWHPDSTLYIRRTEEYRVSGFGDYKMLGQLLWETDQTPDSVYSWTWNADSTAYETFTIGVKKKEPIMPLKGTPEANFDMRSGTTITSDVLTSWTDGVYTLSEPSGFGGPVTNLESLNGNAVASFRGDAEEDVLQGAAGLDRRNAFNDAWILEHYVIKMPNNGDSFNYISDGNAANRIATYHRDDDIVTRTASKESKTGQKPVDTWAIITVQRVDSGTGTVDIWIDGTKIVSGGSGDISSGSGITLGVRGDLVSTLFGEFDLAHYVLYVGASADAFSDADIESNIAFLQSEWGLGGGATEVSFSLNSATNVSSSSQSIAEAGISLNADADVSDGSTATGESDLTISHIQQASTQSTAQAESSFSLPTVQQVTTVSDTQEVNEASFSLALQKAITTEQISTIEVSYSLNATQQASIASDATGEASMSLTLQAGLSLVSTALAEAGISFNAVQSLTLSGQAVGVEVTLSDGRTLTIKLQNRTFTIAEDNRTFIIDDDNRTLNIDP